MTEESVTKYFMKWIQENGWDIISYDFPESGSGYRLQPNNELRNGSKNKDSIIPDIIALRKEVLAFWENKNRYFADDFDKLEKLIITDDYSDSIQKLLEDNNAKSIIRGIGIPDSLTEIEKIKQTDYNKVNFICVVKEDGTVRIIYGNN